MKVLNIHGYLSESTENHTNTAHKALTELGYDVVSPTIDYNANNPNAILELLRAAFLESGCDVVVGTSLGGFYAGLLSAELDCPCVLLNPCVLPFVYLPRCGWKANRYGTTQYIELLQRFTQVDKRLAHAAVGAKDELIDSLDFTERLLGGSKFIAVPDGGHSLSYEFITTYFADVLPAIDKLIGGVEDTFAI